MAGTPPDPMELIERVMKSEIGQALKDDSDAFQADVRKGLAAIWQKLEAIEKRLPPKV